MQEQTIRAFAKTEADKIENREKRKRILVQKRKFVIKV